MSGECYTEKAPNTWPDDPGTFVEQAPEPDAKESAQAEPGAVFPENVDYLTGSTPRTTVAGVSSQRRHMNQNHIACPVAHALFWAPLQC